MPAKITPKICFALLGLLGFLIVWDYGISPDEEQQRLIGQTSLKFIGHYFQIPFLMNGEAPLPNPSDIFLNFKDRDYGVAFEMPAELLIKILGITSIDSAYYFRHCLTFLSFTSAVYAVYMLAKIRFNHWIWGLVAATFMILSPRIFGDAFFNDKDLVFLSAYVVATYTLVNYLRYPSYKAAILHGVICGIAIDIRIMAIIIPIATILISTILIFSKFAENKKLLKLVLVFLVSTSLTILIFWPWLWLDPFGNFFEAFKNMSKFRWGGEMYFMGDIVNSLSLPWIYVPVWLGVTTPLIYIFLFFTGLTYFCKNIYLNRFNILSNNNLLQDLLVIGLFFGPLFAVIALNSVLYNGWRHLYFIYPSFVLIAILGLFWIWTILEPHKIFSSLLVAIVSMSLMLIAGWMIKYHPYQYLYFNIFAGNWERNYDVDYWGVAYRRPLENILKKNSSDKVYVFNNMGGMSWGLWQIPYWQNLPFINELDRNRLDGTRSENCSDFVITSSRGNANQYSQRNDFHLFDEIKINGHLVYATFKRNDPIESFYPAPGKLINFSKKATQCFLKSGWGHTEDWGVWSTSADAFIEFPRPSKPFTQATLVLKPLINSKKPIEVVKIQINSNLEYEYTLTQPKEYVINIPIPSSEQNVDKVNLKIHLANAISPKDLGISQDDRRLGVGLISITFH